MARKLFQKGGPSPNPNGRPPGTGYRKEFDAALKRYGPKKFWDETFIKAKTDSVIRAALIRKMLPDTQEHSGIDGSPLQLQIIAPASGILNGTKDKSC